MNWYSTHLLPRLINRSMGSKDLQIARANIVGLAEGVVLEVGFGSGYNLPFYRNMERLYALEPSRALYDYAAERTSSVGFPITWLPHSIEAIPLPDNSIDTVLSTWTLCSVPDLAVALKEIYRVLKPGGKFLYVEHGQSPKKLLATVQKLLTPIGRHFTGNCHLDRNMGAAITKAGFTVKELPAAAKTERPLAFPYQGVAIKPQYS